VGRGRGGMGEGYRREGGGFSYLIFSLCEQFLTGSSQEVDSTLYYCSIIGSSPFNFLNLQPSLASKQNTCGFGSKFVKIFMPKFVTNKMNFSNSSFAVFGNFYQPGRLLIRLSLYRKRDLSLSLFSSLLPHLSISPPVSLTVSTM
jgi:hypothetical protein